MMLFFGSEGVARASALATHWQPAVPEAAFVGIELDWPADPLLLRSAVRHASNVHAVQSMQTVLFGMGAAGGMAVDSVLQGLLPIAGVIGVDISAGSESRRMVASAAMVRLIQHSTDDDPRASGLQTLVNDMRRHELDVRSMVLPSASRSDPAVAIRASGTFLVELVANASRASGIPRS
jgi:hypothetical protein